MEVKDHELQQAVNTIVEACSWLLNENTVRVANGEISEAYARLVEGEVTRLANSLEVVTSFLNLVSE